jgi:plastocyanin
MEGTLTIGEASAPPAEGEAPPASEGTPAGEQPPAEGDAPPAGGGGPVVLEAHDPFSWSTKELTAKPGDVISVTNTGVIPHDFSIDEFGGILIDLPGGGGGEWTVPADASGSYTYYCAVPGHRQSGMEGTLTIG